MAAARASIAASSERATRATAMACDEGGGGERAAADAKEAKGSDASEAEADRDSAEDTSEAEDDDDSSAEDEADDASGSEPSEAIDAAVSRVADDDDDDNIVDDDDEEETSLEAAPIAAATADERVTTRLTGCTARVRTIAGRESGCCCCCICCCCSCCCCCCCCCRVGCGGRLSAGFIVICANMPRSTSDFFVESELAASAD